MLQCPLPCSKGHTLWSPSCKLIKIHIKAGFSVKRLFQDLTFLIVKNFEAFFTLNWFICNLVAFAIHVHKISRYFSQYSLRGNKKSDETAYSKTLENLFAVVFLMLKERNAEQIIKLVCMFPAVWHFHNHLICFVSLVVRHYDNKLLLFSERMLRIIMCPFCRNRWLLLQQIIIYFAIWLPYSEQKPKEVLYYFSVVHLDE